MYYWQNRYTGERRQSDYCPGPQWMRVGGPALSYEDDTNSFLTGAVVGAVIESIIDNTPSYDSSSSSDSYSGGGGDFGGGGASGDY